MYELSKLFFDIAIFNKGPQDIPASKWLLQLLVPVYMLINILILLMNTDMFTALMQSCVEVILVLGMAQLTLYLSGKLARFQQTACALLGTDALISLLAIPALASLVGRGSAIALLIVILMMLWHWVVTAYILMNALERPLIFALGVAFLYILISYQVIGFLFPPIAV